MRNALLRLPSESIAQLVLVYQFANLRVHETATHCWISGFADESQLETVLAKISPVELFNHDESGHVFRRNDRVPIVTGFNEIGNPIQSFVSLRLPAALLAGKANGKSTVTLKRVDEKNAGHFSILPNALICKIAELQEWSDTTSAFKMKQLVFAASSDRSEVLVRGKTLPPIGGKYFCDVSGIAVPAGYRVAPDIQPSLLRECLSLSADDLLLFDVDEPPKRIESGKFAAVCRSAIRLTAQELNRDS